MENETTIYTRQAGRDYIFSTDALTAAGLLRLVDTLWMAQRSVTLHARPNRIDGQPAGVSHVWLTLTSPADLLFHSTEAMADKGVVEGRRRKLAHELQANGFVTLHEESTS